MVKSVPILTYHHVNPLEGDMVTVSVNHFEEQMSFLHRKGYQTLFVSELAEWMQGKRTVPRRSVVLSTAYAQASMTSRRTMLMTS